MPIKRLPVLLDSVSVWLVIVTLSEVEGCGASLRNAFPSNSGLSMTALSPKPRPCLLLLLLFGMMMPAGCSKDELTTEFATVINTGSFSSGGCEWIIQFTSGLYQPRNLPVDFQTDGLPVEVTYSIVQATADCPMPQNYKGRIHIHRIKRI